MPTDATVFIVDDDPDMLRSLECLIGTVRLPVKSFDSAEQFLESYHAGQPGCLLLDVRMPGMSGLQLLEHLQKLGMHLPVIVLTGHGDVPMVLQALKSGAFAFLEKPAAHQQILDCIQEALAVDQDRRARELEWATFQQRLARLSEREREVLGSMVEGAPNKAIALELGISERTLEKHRKSVLDKMEAHSVVELTRMIVLRQSDAAKS